ncbi:MAG: DUF2278 family protein [Magnetococcales bacterium]|nr:DUF2278 family protein [Magnetococcales bacterium]
MSLNDGYGVLVGTLHHYVRDPPDDYGRYYHENIYVNTPAGQYHCAVDVDSKKADNGIEWRIVTLSPGNLKGVHAFSGGWHALAMNATSGALDYVRTAAFHKPIFGLGALVKLGFMQWLADYLKFKLTPKWQAGTSLQALQALEPLLDHCKRLFIYGEPFNSGLGVHNIHQNQGDPVSSPWAAENGIWQDGCPIIEKQNGTIVAFQTKFKTQSYKTDNNGHPLP